MDRITITELAELAGVSIATVSRVINGKTVRPAYKEKVLSAMRSLDYAPLPGHGKTASAQTLGMLVPDLGNDYYARIANSAIMRAHEQGKNIIVCSCDGEKDLEAAMLGQLSSKAVDALLYCPVSSPVLMPDSEILGHRPIVVVARRGVLPGRPHVYSDNVKGGYVSTRYLRRLGRKHIAMLMGFWQLEKELGDPGELISCLGTPICGAYSSLDRLEGHRKALEEDGLPLSPEMLQVSGYDFGSGYEAAKSLMARMVPIDAIIAPNDAVAAGVIRFLSEQHVAVPEEISVIGYDDSAIAMMTTPTLTSIRQDMRRIGSAAVDLAMELIQGSAVEDVIVDVSLSIRKSTCGV
jgi:LacI family transcriptional regulator